jgi:hypothetical protein
LIRIGFLKSTRSGHGLVRRQKQILVNSWFGLTVKESVWRRPGRNECFFGGLGRSARPKELIAVAARCDITTICRNTWLIAAQEETLETRAWRPI